MRKCKPGVITLRYFPKTVITPIEPCCTVTNVLINNIKPITPRTICKVYSEKSTIGIIFSLVYNNLFYPPPNPLQRGTGFEMNLSFTIYLHIYTFTHLHIYTFTHFKYYFSFKI